MGVDLARTAACLAIAKLCRRMARYSLAAASSPSLELWLANRQDFERRLRPEDLLLVPPFPADMGILDWHRHTELMTATYHWAMVELARLKAEGRCAAPA